MCRTVVMISDFPPSTTLNTIACLEEKQDKLIPIQREMCQD